MRALRFIVLGSVPFLLPLACTGLNTGDIVIVDEDAGSPGSGGTGGSASGNAGKGATGGSAGSKASGGRAGAGGGTGATSGDAGEAGTGANAGTGNATGGTSSGGSANGGTSNGGSANGGTGNVPSDCSTSTDCDSTIPICEGGSCRACTTSGECAARDGTQAFCDKTAGACVECLKSTDCGSSRPVCDDHVCRHCQEGSECASGACNGGRCADESSVVYALAGTGSYDMDCGTKDKPCISLQTAASHLAASRPFLVLLATNLEFTDGIAFPPMLDVTVFGNHVKVSTYNYTPPEPTFTIAGGNVTLDDIVIEQTGDPMGSDPTTAILCTAGTLKARRLSVTNGDPGYSSSGMHLTDCSAEVRESEFIGNVRGLVSDSSLPNPAQSLVVERSLFQNNKEALQFEGDHFLIRNNLFVSNGLTSYVRIVRPIAHAGAGVQSYFVYNTLYGNDNNCSYEGGLIACEGGAMACGVMSSNITWGNMFNGGGGGDPCPDQVYVNAPSISYSIAETTWPGSNNSSSDPLFTDPMTGDFTLQAGSPAIDKGNPDANFVPAVDYYGNPRPVGDGPDIGAIEAPPETP